MMTLAITNTDREQFAEASDVSSNFVKFDPRAKCLHSSTVTIVSDEWEGASRRSDVTDWAELSPADRNHSASNSNNFLIFLNDFGSERTACTTLS